MILDLKLVYDAGLFKKKPEPVELDVDQYANGRLALRLLAWDGENESHEPFAVCTVNLPGEYLEPDEIFVKDYSENEGMADWMIRNNLIMPEAERHVRSGFVQIGAYKITLGFYHKIFNATLAEKEKG